MTLDGDSTHYTAHVVGTDKDTDLAVIKIDADHDLPIAKLGNSDGVQVGDWVLAFGSPFGLNSTMTAGIVSAQGPLQCGTSISTIYSDRCRDQSGKFRRPAGEHGRGSDWNQHGDLYGQPRI